MFKRNPTLKENVKNCISYIDRVFEIIIKEDIVIGNETKKAVKKVLKTKGIDISTKASLITYAYSVYFKYGFNSFVASYVFYFNEKELDKYKDQNERERKLNSLIAKEYPSLGYLALNEYNMAIQKLVVLNKNNPNVASGKITNEVASKLFCSSEALESHVIKTTDLEALKNGGSFSNDAIDFIRKTICKFKNTNVKKEIIDKVSSSVSTGEAASIR